jgi:hypothetical protein
MLCCRVAPPAAPGRELATYESEGQVAGRFRAAGWAIYGESVVENGVAGFRRRAAGGIPGHPLGPGRVGPGQDKARNWKWLPRPGPARLSGLKNLPRPGPSVLFSVGPSGFRAGPSQKSPNLLPRPGPSKQSGRISVAQARPSGQKTRPRPEIFGPGRAGLVGPGFPCPGIAGGEVGYRS